jgi:hypothetical protein
LKTARDRPQHFGSKPRSIVVDRANRSQKFAVLDFFSFCSVVIAAFQRFGSGEFGSIQFPSFSN